MFKAAMVRGILDRRKLMTRRVLKPQPTLWPDGKGIEFIDASGNSEIGGTAFMLKERLPDLMRYKVGDRLWVREAWRTPKSWDCRSPSQLETSCREAGWKDKPWCPIHWEADGSKTNWADWREEGVGRLRASMHLPRAFSRITLEVTDVKTERLQDISEEDAKAEGIYWSKFHEGWTSGMGVDESCDYHAARASVAFMKLWGRINGDDSRDANPWVEAYTFKQIGE